MTDPNQTSVTDTLSVNGSLQYVWSSDSSCPPPASACASYSGSSGIVVTRLPASLDMSVETNGASLGALPAGHGITVTGRPNPAQIGSFATPLTLIGGGWYFTNAAGVTSPFGCDLFVTPGSLTCSPQLYESGSFSLHAVVNGLHITGTPYVVTVVQPTIAISLSHDTVAVGDTVIVSTAVTPAGERQDQEQFRLRLTLDSGAAPPPVIFSRGQTQVATTANANALRTPHTQAADAVPVPACQPTHPLMAKCYLVTNTAGSLKITESVRYNGVTVSAEKVVRVNVSAPPSGGCDASSAANRIAPGNTVLRNSAPSGAAVHQLSKLNASQKLCDDQDLSITITKAAGVNGDAGSFTTLAAESKITLSAAVSPSTAVGAVKWTIAPVRIGTYTPRAPQPVADGANSSFVVPATVPSRKMNAQTDNWRWPHDHTASLDLASKRMAYAVVASVTVDGKTATSAPVTVMQDADDVLRQEYIDFKKDHILDRAEISTEGDARLNYGDYAHWPSNARSRELLPVLQTLAKNEFGAEMVIRSGFRNPVHHHFHAGATALESAHLYAGAVDFAILNPPTVPAKRATPGTPGHPPTPATPAKRLSVLEYFNDIKELAHDATVGGCFEPADVIKRGSSDKNTLDHAHVHWADDCKGW